MQTLHIHPDNPQPRLINKVVQTLKNDELIILPTQYGYVFGFEIHAKIALQTLKQLCQLDDKYMFTLLCQNLSQVATYATIDNHQYRLLKTHTPAATTFILDTKDIPKKLIGKHKKVGIQILDDNLILAILENLDTPIVTSPVILPQHDKPLDIEEIEHHLGRHIEIFVDAGFITTQMVTTIDLTQTPPNIVRQGVVEITI